jgi:hypothetical protein
MCIVRHKTEKTAEDVHVRAADDTELSKFIYVCNPENCKGVRLTLDGTKPVPTNPATSHEPGFRLNLRQFLNQNSDDAGRCVGATTMLFTLEEDCSIDDVARNPTHAGRVPSSA